LTELSLLEYPIRYVSDDGINNMLL